MEEERRRAMRALFDFTRGQLVQVFLLFVGSEDDEVPHISDRELDPLRLLVMSLLVSWFWAAM